YLYITSPFVERRGAREAYLILAEVRRELDAQVHDPFEQLDPFAMKILGPTHPLAREVLELYQRFPADRPTFHHGSSLGFVPIEVAYISPAKMFAPQAA